MTDHQERSPNTAEVGPFELAMFPLGSTVFPQQVVPLHVFEERYRTMLSHLTSDDADPSFGIALIDRGHEVGGGDERLSVATRVQIVQAEQYQDGRWGLIVAGVERLDIIEWLPDNPYPRALVTPRTVVDNGGSSIEDLEALVLELITTMAQHAGVEQTPEYSFSTDPRTRLDQLCAVAPLTDFDRQNVLEAATTSAQMRVVTEAIEDKLLVLRAQMGPDGEVG